jgi:hypothetical protein
VTFRVSCSSLCTAARVISGPSVPTVVYSVLCDTFSHILVTDHFGNLASIDPEDGGCIKTIRTPPYCESNTTTYP